MTHQPIPPDVAFFVGLGAGVVIGLLGAWFWGVQEQLAKHLRGPPPFPKLPHRPEGWGPWGPPVSREVMTSILESNLRWRKRRDRGSS